MLLLTLDPQKLPEHRELQYSVNLKLGKAQVRLSFQKNNNDLEMTAEVTAGSFGFSLFKLAERALWSQDSYGPQLYEESEVLKKRKKVWTCEDRKAQRSTFQNEEQTGKVQYDLIPYDNQGTPVTRSFLDPLSLVFALQTVALENNQEILLQVLGSKSPVFLKLSFPEERMEHIPLLHSEPTPQLRAKIELLGGEVGPSFSVVNEGPVHVWIDKFTGIISKFEAHYSGFHFLTGSLVKC